VNDVEDSNKKESDKMNLSSIGLRERKVWGWEEKKMNVFVCIIVRLSHQINSATFVEHSV
jgi:hypothetical protein